MELRHLRYFIMVAEERHFTRAALRLNMQQPPLSQQIRALETELGFDLFKRHSKGVDLTAGGSVFLHEARDIMARVELGARKAELAALGVEGTLSIGFTSSAALHPLIPKIIRRYREKHTGVEIKLTEGSAKGLTEDVVEKRIDLGILRAPVGQHPAIEFHRLLNEEMLLVLPVGHPLLARAMTDDNSEPTIAIADLRNEPFILVRRPGAPGMYANFMGACEHAGFTPLVACEVERMFTNVSLVASGMGLSVVPASMRNALSESVVYCRVRDARPRLVAPITLVCAHFNQPPPLGNFIELARKMGKEYRMAARE